MEEFPCALIHQDEGENEPRDADRLADGERLGVKERAKERGGDKVGTLHDEFLYGDAAAAFVRKEFECDPASHDKTEGDYGPPKTRPKYADIHYASGKKEP